MSKTNDLWLSQFELACEEHLNGGLSDDVFISTLRLMGCTHAEIQDELDAAKEARHAL